MTEKAASNSVRLTLLGFLLAMFVQVAGLGFWGGRVAAQINEMDRRLQRIERALDARVGIN
jgi:hypothetical protein